MNICLYGASSPALDRAYFDAAEKFGEFANSILPYDVKRARKINIEEY